MTRYLLISNNQLDDGQAVEDGDGEQVPVVHHGLPGQQQMVLPGQVRHKQERFRPENILNIKSKRTNPVRLLNYAGKI